MPAPIIAFDLDGTLVDTAPDLLDALDLVLGERGIAPVDRSVARNLIGRGARQLILRALQRDGVEMGAADLDQMTARFIAFYADNIAAGSRPFPGLPEALDGLSAGGARLAVCTNKAERLARLLLDALNLTARFDAITGADTYARNKPDPLPLLSTIAACGGTPARALMVGDSATDIATARAAGVPSIAVSFGYTEVPAAELGADRLITSFAELQEAVDALLPSRA